ncbi:DUF3048 domain-containing protein [Cellulomonas fengjieae]|uniref:DUF3048 domain-containing protein n=1 Tax=Cellulomonas fengjieae TaxID=2819978 RepID=A0ABS3SEV3_9CELL|nr:DUF3048 domain-containing protein [Cellulomonas fengjieae]MBO3083480.1 DUF3048 domain-containing protein [Cellulomonas fengjieae]QVI65193.1 DUF3048 domain-containing protein [Cellulomonas fengjieae]
MSPVLTVPPARRRTTAVAALVTGAALVLGACSGSPTDASPGPASTQRPVIDAAKVAPPAPVVPPRWPLTGVAAAEVSARPALAIKIENSGESRPQTGLDQADVVWEQVVEGGISRFVAIYQSQVPAEVGPIRSVRPMDPAIAAPTHGLIAFSGGQQQFVQDLKNAGLQTISMDAGAGGFYRKKGVAPAPHNVYGTPQVFWDQADDGHSAAPATQFVIARTAEKATAVVAGGVSSTVAVRLSGSALPTWTWDAGTGTWLRAEGTAPATLRSGARIAAANVVTLSVRLVDSGTRDPAGNPVPETVLEGTGEATVSSGGHTVTGTWTKTGTDAVLALTTADGAVLSLAPGITWVELVPRDSGAVTIS